MKPTPAKALLSHAIPSLRVRCWISLFVAMGGPLWAHSAHAAGDELIITEAQRTKEEAASPLPGEVRLYGPFPVTDAIRGAKDSLNLYLDGVDFHDDAGNVTVFLVDASAPAKKRTIKLGDYVTGIGNMKGMIVAPVNMFQTIHDTDDPEQKPLTHLKGMSRFMLALVVQHGRFKFDRIVITTVKRVDAVDAGSTAAAAAPAPPARPALVSGELAVQTSPSLHVEEADGKSVDFSAAVFLSNTLARGSGSLYLHLEGVRLAPGGEAEVYLVDRDHQRVDPSLLIGRITRPSQPATGAFATFLEIKDFEQGGKRRTPRTALRGMAHFAIALRAPTGTARVDHFILSTLAPAARVRALEAR